MHHLVVRLAVALAVVFPAAAIAQVRSTFITASGGVDAVLYDGSKSVPAYVGQLALEWRPGSSRGALRLGLMHYQQNRTDPYFGCDPMVMRCEITRKYGATGLNVDGSFDLSRGRIRPYLASGGGVFRSLTTTRGDYDCLSGCNEPEYPWMVPASRSQWSGALHAGAGLSAKLGQTPVFTELRVMMLATDGFRARGMIPLTFGVKF